MPFHTLNSVNTYDQGINVIIATVSLFQNKSWNKKISNYVEIYIETELNKIIKFKKQEVYKNKQNIIGKNIRAELPKNSNIKLINNFSKNTNQLSKELIKLLKKKYK